ncbi:shikimate kinase [Candidatus Kuenenbacteria bacterium]|nr:shikimate kinase [Candidatus Kuenenbacteria bacterium]OIP77111.1 MAG: hypothetical protein AUK09_00510 [Parcubacteria group bacterium CG2_30_36_38]
MKIILIGFMGAGKTAVAKKLSKKLDLPAVEMDDLILKKSGRKSINEIFARDTELHFRELEIEVAKNLKKQDNRIISTGGGIVMNKIIIDYLKAGSGKIIFLKSSFSEIKKRVGNSKKRPLFKNRKTALELFNFRQQLYRKYADFVVRTDNKSIDAVADEIVNYLLIKKI